MKHLPVFLLVFFSMIFTGCFDILEDISVNKNGSGKYKITFDMDGIINDPFMKQMLLEAVKNEGNVAVEGLEDFELDSIIYFKDDPQFAKYKDNKTLYESAQMQMMVSEKKGKMFVNFGFDFDSFEDIDSFFKSFNENNEAKEMFAGFDQIVSGSQFAFKKKRLTRLPPMKEGANLTENIKKDDMAMLEMFMANANLKTTYSFPGKVKKSSIPNSVIENNQVKVTIPLLDMVEGKAQMDGEIKFKNR